MILISKSSKKKDLHRRPSSQKTRIINKFQRNEVFSQKTSKTLKQLELKDKKYKTFIDNMVTEGLLKEESRDGFSRYWLNAEKNKPKQKNNQFLIMMLVSSFVFIIVMVILLI